MFRWWTIWRLTRKLKGRDHHARWHAALELGYLRDRRAFKPLLAALNTVGKEAACALGRTGDPRALDVLREALNGQEKELRRGAAEGLGELGDPRAVNDLVRALGDEDTRCEAAKALGRIGDAQVIEPLLRAVRTAGRLVDSFLPAVSDALRKIGLTPAVKPLISALEDDNYEVLAAVVVLLRDSGDRCAAAPLWSAYQRVITSRAYNDLHKQKALAPIAEALLALGDHRAADAFLPLLDSPDRHVRARALSALAKSGNRSPAVVDRVIGLLDPGDINTGKAIALLATIRDVRAVEPLVALMRSCQSKAREVEMKKKQTSSDAGETITQWQSTYIRYQALAAEGMRGLGAIGNATALRPLLECARGRDHADVAVEALSGVLRSDAAGASAEDLKQIVAFRDVPSGFFRAEYHQQADMTHEDFEWKESTVDCSDLRASAQTELRRRGQQS